jgi:hypothetical protein
MPGDSRMPDSPPISGELADNGQPVNAGGQLPSGDSARRAGVAAELSSAPRQRRRWISCPPVDSPVASASVPRPASRMRLALITSEALTAWWKSDRREHMRLTLI